jgi:hypothetical protein
VGGEISVSSLLHAIVGSGLDPAIFTDKRDVKLNGLTGRQTVPAISAR